MAARKALVGFAVLALGAGMAASVAIAFSPCGRRACSDEVSASGLSGQARGACVKQVLADCRAGLCSCTGGSPPCSCVCGDGTVRTLRGLYDVPGGLRHVPHNDDYHDDNDHNVNNHYNDATALRPVEPVLQRHV
jgi:hypothetical protein